MIDFIGGIYSILFGLFFVICHSKLGEIAINLWDKRFPRIKIWRKGYNVSFLIAGIVFFVFGLLIVFQAIKLK